MGILRIEQRDEGRRGMRRVQRAKPAADPTAPAKRKARRDNNPRRISGTAVRRAVEAIGGQAEVARQLGIRQASVFGWIKRNRAPAERVGWLSMRSGVPRSELRPDLYRRGE